LRGLGDGTVSTLVLKFKIMRKQFSQVLTVIVIVPVDVVQEVNKPVAEVYFVGLAASQHGSKHSLKCVF